MSATSKLSSGMSAPDFELLDQNGKLVRLSKFHNHRVVLYFYPRADTPGCTTEACGFRDVHEQLKSHGAILLGISPDQVAINHAFDEKYVLQFTLLSDPEKKVVKQYGVWQTMQIGTRELMGIKRTTFILDEAGVIRDIITSFDVKTHAKDVLQRIADKDF